MMMLFCNDDDVACYVADADENVADAFLCCCCFVMMLLLLLLMMLFMLLCNFAAL